MCIGFSTNESLKDIRKIIYLTENDEKPSCWVNDPQLEKKIKDSLYKKFKYWENESEYRIIQEDEYIHFNKEEIKYFIIGHKVPEEYKKVLTETCKKFNIPVFITYPDKISRKILIKNVHFKLIYDGRKIESDL